MQSSQQSAKCAHGVMHRTCYVTNKHLPFFLDTYLTLQTVYNTEQLRRELSTTKLATKISKK